MPVFKLLSKHGISLDEVYQRKSYKETVDGSLRNKIISRDGLECAYSEKKLTEEEAVIDHIVPRSSGGTNSPDNLVVVADDINSKKAAKSLKAFCYEMGFDYVKVNQRVFDRISKPINTYPIGFQSLQEKDKDKDKDKEKDKDKDNANPWKSRLNALFHRRENTAWSEREKKAIRTISQHPSFESELAEIEAYYATGHKYLRKDLLTLINNWAGELDRARNYVPESESKPSKDIRPSYDEYIQMKKS
jgi:hypothetical protein